MYVRRKPNRSGSTSVVVVEKKAGKVCYLKTIGVSSDQQEIDELMDLFGVFLLVLIGIELLDTIKVYLRRNVVHVEVVVLVAIIALARKVVVLKIEELSGNHILGIGVLIVSLSIAYYLI
ncbi:MAG: phosphate-starvation-inducible PsiE family protein [Salinivirgaceae bacterium]|nr:phosphate-starvation-inducible PsiE family protein [Salinivirgaceae bacterium]